MALPDALSLGPIKVWNNESPGRRDCRQRNRIHKGGLSWTGMASSEGLPSHRIDRVCRHMLEDQDMFLKQLLPPEQIEASLQRHPVCLGRWLHTPLVTS